MDVNQTKFHLLLGKSDWANCSENERTLGEIWASDEVVSPPEISGNFYWNHETNQLTLQPQLFQFTASESDTAPKLEDRRGAARDRYGNWFWIDETDFKIRVLSQGTNRASDFYPVENRNCQTDIARDFQPAEFAGESALIELRGLCVTTEHYLIVGTVQPAGLLIFDLFARNPPRRILWHAEIGFAPFDIAARTGGGAFVLDRENQRLWTLDRNFNLVANKNSNWLIEKIEEFQFVDQDAKRKITKPAQPNDLIENFAVELDALADPIAVECLPDDTVLILDREPDRKFSKIYYFRGSELIGALDTNEILPLVEVKDRADFQLVGFDFAFAPSDETAHTGDRLYVASAAGNQTFAFNLIATETDSPPAERLKLEPVHEFFPMRLFGGKGLVKADNQIFYDLGERWLKLIAQKRPRFTNAGELVTKEFDGKEPDCVWHRILLDACLPAETNIRVLSRAANEKSDLEFAAWQFEPAFYLRGNGAELSFVTTLKTNREQGTGTWETLLQKARGRWLQLKFEIAGNEQKSPRLSALRVYYPRFSYLKNYLPAVYREDQQSADFLERFFANFEGFYTNIEDRIAAAQMLFDVRSAPAETLDWLANWFGVALDPWWSEAKRRLFISRALDFFQWRGTLRGLRTALLLALDDCADERIFDRPNKTAIEHIRITEKFVTRRTASAATDNTVLTEINLPRVVNAAERWRPAHGVDVLNQKFTEFMREQSARETGEIERQIFEFPASLSSGDGNFALWQRFSQTVLNFVPSDAGANERRRWQSFLRANYSSIALLNRSHSKFYTGFDEIRLPQNLDASAIAKQDWLDFIEATNGASRQRRIWQNFLARRYNTMQTLNQIYRTDWLSFDQIPLVDRLPQTNQAVGDWFEFESIVLAMHRTAHQFTVLVPLPLTVATRNSAEQRRRLELVERIVNLEKPAHTVFDVRFYWNLFRVGEARIGADTLLGLGSRDPLLAPDFKLGESFAGETRAADLLSEQTRLRRTIGQRQF